MAHNDDNHNDVIYGRYEKAFNELTCGEELFDYLIKFEKISSLAQNFPHNNFHAVKKFMTFFLPFA